jgi:Zn finger protein HypA/HybF involved in hydrogenase expression
MPSTTHFLGKGTSVHVKRNFVAVKCVHCDRSLHSVLIGTEVMCPVCNRWYVAQAERKVS